MNLTVQPGFKIIIHSTVNASGQVHYTPADAVIIQPGGGVIELFQSNGTRTIYIDADNAGDGRISTQVLEITGGSDFS